MLSILLLSADRTLDKIIRAALPPNISLQVEEPSTPLHEILVVSSKPMLILVDADKGLDVMSRLPTLGLDGLPVVAIISNPDERQDLFQVGVRDYLIKPLVLEEISTRLNPYLQEQDIDGIQKGQSQQMSDGAVLEHLTKQIIQNERWITIGRLIASICHEITNRMQAIQGALSLAAEEPDLSNDLHTYISICQQETRRVSTRVETLRYIYHPNADPVVGIDITKLLNDIITLSSDRLTTRGATIETSLTDDLPIIRGRLGQSQFVLLGFLLNLIDLIGLESGSRIRVAAGRIGPTVQIEFSTEAPLSVISSQNTVEESELPAYVIESALGLPTLRQVILTMNGNVGLLLNKPGLSVWCSLPIV